MQQDRLVMALILDPLLCVILSGVMFICSGFASYGCYRCATDVDDSKIVPEGNEYNFLKQSKERYRLKLFRRRPSTSSSEATIYSVHSSEIWGSSRKSTPRGSISPGPSPSPRGSLRVATPTMFINASQIRGWTIKEEPELEDMYDSRRKSAPT